MPDKKFAKPVISSLFFLAAAIGELYFLRRLFTLPFSQLPIVLIVEILSIAVLIWSAAKSAGPDGWGSLAGCGHALVLYAAYAGFCAVNYEMLAQAYLTGFDAPSQSYGTALVAGKLALVLMGLIAAIPAKKQMSGEEYSDLFVDMMERQKVEWAKAGARGAKKDLEAAELAMMELSGQGCPEVPQEKTETPAVEPEKTND